MTTAVRLSNIGHTYTGARSELSALTQVTASIRAGEFVSIVGPSGCGKTTLLNIVAGLLNPTEGEITVEDQAPEAALAQRRIGLVFQDPALLPWRTAEQNICLPLELTGKSGSGMSAMFDSVFTLVQLSGFERAYPQQLSGGMKSRVAIARALVTSPAILLMDEPFGSLDELTAQTLSLELLRIWNAIQATVLLVTHSISQAVFMSDRVLIMSPRPGSIIEEVPITLPRPRSEHTLSSSQFSQLAALIRESLGGIARPPSLECHENE